MLPAATLRLRTCIALIAFGFVALISCGGETTSPEPTPSPATSTVSISSLSVASGTTATITLTAKDASGTRITKGSASVAFALASGGTSSGTIGPVIDNGDGTYSATLTGTTAGTARAIAATLGGAAVTTAMPSFIVTPGAFSAAQSVVSVGSGTVASGASTTVTATLKDAAGNSIVTGGATVAFTLGSGTSVGTFGAVTDNANGTYTATFTATAAGTARAIGATVNGSAIASTLPTILVTAPTAGPISPATSLVSVGAATAVSGTTVTLTLQAKDAAGINLSTGGATIVFSTTGSGTSAGTIGATTDNGNGTYAATFAATLAGTPKSIQATINGSAVTTALPTITVTAGAFAAAQSEVSVGSSTVVTSNTTTVTATLRDAAGNALTTGGATVAFTLGAGTSGGTFGTVTDNANGTYSAVFTAGAAGTARTIGATVGGVAITSTLPTITVTGVPAGPISAATSTVTVGSGTVVSGATSTITLQAKDAAGVSLGTGGATVVLQLEPTAVGKSSGTVSAVTDNGNGTYSATFTATTAGTARAVEATIDGAAVTTTMPSFTVTPGAISTAQSTVTIGSATIASGASTTVTLQAKDAADNTITSGGATVAFGFGAGGSTGTFAAVTDNGNGTYTAQLTGVLVGSARGITATIGAAAVTTALPTFTVTPGAISAVTSVVTMSTASIPLTGTATATLLGKDAAGNALTSGIENPTVSFTLTGTGTSAGTFSAATNNNNGTWTATFTPSAEGSARTASATINAATVQTTPPSFIVFAPGMVLSSTSLQLNATQGTAGSTEPLGIFSPAGTSIGGLQAVVTYTSPGVGNCNSITWLGAPTFDVTAANPAAILSVTPNATNLGLHTCTASITISSTTSGIASKVVPVTLSVARGPVAQTAVNLIMMGNASGVNGDQSVPQTVTPDARVLITNGGRGVVTGLHATVSNQVGAGATTPWLRTVDLSWEPAGGDTTQRNGPATLIVKAVATPFDATADITVTGVGMDPIVIPVHVLFNVEPELVTNPRGVVLNAFAGGPAVTSSVVAFNQNRLVEDSLMNYAVDPGFTLPSWLTDVSISPLKNADGVRDTAATYTLTLNPAGLAADTIVVDSLHLIADACETNTDDGICELGSFQKRFSLPVKLIVERGLVLPVTNATLIAAVGSTPVVKDIPITNGGSTPISGLSASITGTPAPWLTASIVGGTTAPATLRLSANPTGRLRGEVLSTTVTIAASSPAGVPSRTVTVTMRVY